MFQTHKTNPKLTTAKTQDQTSKLANWKKTTNSQIKSQNSKLTIKNKKKQNRKVGKILNRKSQT